MKYDILRLEYNKDKTGAVISVFLQVSVTNEFTNDSIIGEYFFTENEKDVILQDETKLKSVIENVFADCQINLEKFIAEKTPPVEFVLKDAAKKKTIVDLISVDNIETLVSDKKKVIVIVNDKEVIP
jgi:hypothetical protein